MLAIQERTWQTGLAILDRDQNFNVSDTAGIDALLTRLKVQPAPE